MPPKSTTNLPKAHMSLLDIEQEAQRAISKFKQAMELLVEYQEHRSRATNGNRGWIVSKLVDETLGYRGANLSEVTINMETVEKEVASNVWYSLLQTTPLWSLLDGEARETFTKDMQESPAPVTVENMESTLRFHAIRAEEYFNRGVVNTFRQLSGKYRSNKPFKLGKKIILSGLYAGYHVHDRMASNCRDMDRAFHLLDGKEYGEKEQREGFSAYVSTLPIYNMCYSDGDHNTYDGEYVKARFYRNGNLHITFKRPDLVKQCNLIIAMHFGDTLASERKK